MPKIFPVVKRQVIVFAGDVDVLWVDSFDLRDALSGVLGPIAAPDTFALGDEFVADAAVLGDTADLFDLLRALEGLGVGDSLSLNDALSGTLGPIAAPDSLDIADEMDAGPLTLQDSLVVSDSPDGQWSIDAAAQDSIALSDALGQIIRVSEEHLTIADDLGDVGRLGADDSLAVADTWGPVHDLDASDSLTLSDARTAGQITTLQADSLDFLGKLRTIDLVPSDALFIVDLIPQADLDMTLWANAAVTASNWDNSANAIDQDIDTFATQGVASSGIGGITNVNEAGDLVLGYPDPAATLSDWVWDSVVLGYRWRTRSAGTQIAAGTVAYTVRYSLNDGAGYTDIETISSPVSDPGAKTTDLSGIADTLTELQQFRFRMNGTIGSGTGLGKQQLIDCYYARLVIAAHRTF